MVPQILHEGRLFWNAYHHDVSPPHSAYLLLTSKDVENPKMFHGGQQFLLTNWPPGSIIPIAENTLSTQPVM
jgi:hypothetical protein